MGLSNFTIKHFNDYCFLSFSEIISYFTVIQLHNKNKNQFFNVNSIKNSWTIELPIIVHLHIFTGYFYCAFVCNLVPYYQTT